MLGSFQGLSPSPHQQPLPQGQQQQQGQHLQPQPGQQQQQQQQQPQIPPPPPQNGQDFTLSSVLHFLQTEWRRYERDRNEWEIERAEMRARIAQLEGERRSFENVKLDLMRRIKMLEYALRMERSKQLTQPTQPIQPAKLAAIQQQNATTSNNHKEETGSHKEGSSGSSPRSEDIPLPPETRAPANGASSIGAPPRPPSWAGSNWPAGPAGAAATINIGKPPPGRDPKSRARSRDYLKQCLQEISYLTSPQAMNPLPNRALLNTGTLPLGLPNVASFDPIYNNRPRKTLPDGNMNVGGKEFPILNGLGGLMSGPGSGPALERPNPMSGIHPPPSAAVLQQQQQQQQQVQQQQPAMPQPQQPMSAPHPLMPGLQTDRDRERESTPSLSSSSSSQADGAAVREMEQQQQPRSSTMVFRPDDQGDWREKLRQSNEAAAAAAAAAGSAPDAASAGSSSSVSGWDEKDDDGETEEDETSVVEEEEEGASHAKGWKAKRTLRNHLDAVRALAFHPTEMCLATGGDDCTVKIWRMDVKMLTSSTRPSNTIDVEPQLTLRGHSAAITRLIHSPTKGLLYSASLDSSIRVWALPAQGHTTYAPYDETRARGELIGHTDAVWDLALVRDEATLISAGAEGAVKVWDVSGPSGGGSLKLSWGWNGVQEAGGEEGQGQQHEREEDAIGATAVEAIKTDLKKVAVAYQNAVVKIFDIETGKETMKLGSDISYDETTSTQINRLASHPTMSLLVTAHEDKYIRIFDITTGQCTHSMPAHLDGVTCLSIDPAGFSLVSGSHDCSIRFWDLLGSKQCVQEFTIHRSKATEGVLDVEFHATLPVMASAGADGIVKIYTSS